MVVSVRGPRQHALGVEHRAPREALASVDAETIRVDVDCAGCTASRAIVVESALPGAVRVELSIERRR